jgi:3-deoxy-D-manno-octulosonic acid kinase
MSEAILQPTAEGAILFDPACPAQAGATAFDPAWFDVGAWRERGAAERAGAGRGDAWFIAAPWGASALRHYRRGGLVAHVLGDNYLWTGAERTRSFAEFRLLVRLRELGFPVPQPLAARYRRRGLYYRADLITRRIADAESLASLLVAARADAALLARVGETIAGFHAAGVYHADLNAHNILVTRERVWLIDFDRGERRRPESGWQRANLARLLRSMHKVLRDDSAAVEHKLWQPLMAAYERLRGVAPAREQRA